MKNTKKKSPTRIDAGAKKLSPPSNPKKHAMELKLKKRLSAISRTSRVTEAVKEQIEDRISIS